MISAKAFLAFAFCSKSSERKRNALTPLDQLSLPPHPPGPLSCRNFFRGDSLLEASRILRSRSWSTLTLNDSRTHFAQVLEASEARKEAGFLDGLRQSSKGARTERIPRNIPSVALCHQMRTTRL